MYLLATIIFFLLIGVGDCNPNPKEKQWTKYHSTKELEEKLIEIHDKCPNHTVVYVIGKSVQGRDLSVIEFSTTPGKHVACKFFYSYLYSFIYLKC